MPSDIRYARADTARRSPSAKLYSAVPRSSQCPSIVITHDGYFLSTAALACRVARLGSLISALSNSKKTGCSGESRFKSSSERADTSSVGNGCGGIGSRTGAGRSGGVVDAVGGGGAGGVGRATGGWLLRH